MAKLNVVIPAVDVMVGGVTYRKVNRKAQAGDIVKALKSEVDLTEGAFYGPLYDSGVGNTGFKDDVNDFRYSILRNYASQFEVFAPVSEPAAEASTDTITFQGATWRKVDRDVREGDAIKFTDEDRSHYLTESELYVVNEVDFNNDPHITDDEDDSYDAGGEDYEVYEKVTGSAAVEYREVKRKAAVGEKIRVTNAPRSGEEFSEGDVLTVSSVDRDGDIWYVEEVDIDGIIFYQHRENGNEYVVLEPVTKTAEPERLKVGEYARVVDVTHMYADSGVAEGSIVKITQDDESYRPFKAALVNGNNAGWFTTTELVRATDEEVASAKRAALIAQFSVGDYVKVAVEYCEHKVGDVLKITNTASGHTFRVDRIGVTSGFTYGYIDADKIVKLTAEEVAEIERKQAEEKRWAAIGRKVNEYKRGDIVKFIRSDRYNALTPGDVGEVVEKDFDGDLRVNTEEITDGNWCKPAQISLIVPVEQRFDREVDAA